MRLSLLATLLLAAPACAQLLAVYESEANGVEYRGVYQAPLRHWLEARGEAFDLLGDAQAADPVALARYDVVLASSVYIVPDAAAAGLAAWVEQGGCLLWVDSPARRGDGALRQALGIGAESAYTTLVPARLDSTEDGVGLFTTSGFGVERWVGNPATTAALTGEILYSVTGSDAAGRETTLPAVTLGRLGAGAGVCVNWIAWLERDPEATQVLSDCLEMLLARRGLEGPQLYALATVEDAHVEQPAPVALRVRLHSLEPGRPPQATCTAALVSADGAAASAEVTATMEWRVATSRGGVAVAELRAPTQGLPDGTYTVRATARYGEVVVDCRPARVTLEGAAMDRVRQTRRERRAALDPLLKGTLGDYDGEPRGADGRVDIPLLLEQIRGAHMNTYDWLIWHAPTDLDDLELFLPLAKEAGLRVWVTLCPPSESGNGMPYSEPHRLDYHAWAHGIGRLAEQYDNLAALVIDDFWSDGNQELFTPEYIAAMARILRGHSPRVALLPTVYISTVGDTQFLRDFGPSIDGIVFPYGELDDPGPLRKQLARCREWIGPDLFLHVNVYASGSDGRSEPGPRSEEYLREALTVSRELTDGVRIYCLPKERGIEDYRYAVTAELYAGWSGRP